MSTRGAKSGTNGKRAASRGAKVAVVAGEPASKRALRSQGRKTMRKLLDAAMVVFARRGYHAARVDDIVKVARTSHGTFYLYFSNKEDLLRALVGEAGEVVAALDDALGPVGPGRGRMAGAARVDGALLRSVAALRPRAARLDRPRHERHRARRPGPRRRGRGGPAPWRRASTGRVRTRASTPTPRPKPWWPWSTASINSGSSPVSPSTRRPSTPSPPWCTGRSSAGARRPASVLSATTAPSTSTDPTSPGRTAASLR